MNISYVWSASASQNSESYSRWIIPQTTGVRTLPSFHDSLSLPIPFNSSLAKHLIHNHVGNLIPGPEEVTRSGTLHTRARVEQGRVRPLSSWPQSTRQSILFVRYHKTSKDWSTNDRSYDPSLFSGKQLEWKGRRCDKNLISYVSLREEIECPRLSLSPRLDLHSFSVLRRDLL